MNDDYNRSIELAIRLSQMIDGEDIFVAYNAMNMVHDEIVTQINEYNDSLRK